MQSEIKIAKIMCEEFLLKIPNSSLQKSFQYILKTLDYQKLVRGEYTYDHLTHTCANNIVRWPIICAILKHGGCTNEDSIKFIDNTFSNITKIQNIKEIVKNGDLPYVNASSSECLNILYDIISDAMLLKEKQPTELMQIIHDLFKNKDTYVKLKQLIDYTAHFLNKYNENEKSIIIQEIYQVFIETNQQTADVAFSRESRWKKMLMDFLREKNSDRLLRSSAYPEITLRKNMAFSVMLFRHLESYIEKHHKNAPRALDKLQWFFDIVEINELENALVYIANNYIFADNDRVKSKHAKHHCYDFLKVAIILVRDRIPHYFTKCQDNLSTLNVTNLLSRINDQREVPVETVRRHFYEDEITQIIDHVSKGKDGAKYSLIFTILREVGLRIGAVCSLRFKNLMNAKGEFLETGKKLEKGRKIRSFPIGQNLREKITQYIQENEGIFKDINSFMFPSNTKSGYISTDSVREKLNRVTESLGIHGHHVHPHAFRHTIVNNLMAHGNKLENVSRYIGHTSIATTEQYYWTTELENIIPTMSIPWLKKKDSFEETTDRHTEVDLDKNTLIGIIVAYHSVVTNEQKITIKQRIPNIEEIFADICSGVASE